MKNSQQGAALLVSLVLTGITATATAVTAKMVLQSERGASNATQQGSAFLAAEAGVQTVRQAFQELLDTGWEAPQNIVWEGDDITDLGGAFAAGAGSTRAVAIPFSQDSGFWVESITYTDDSARVVVGGTSLTGLGTKRISVVMSFVGGEITVTPSIIPNAPGQQAIVACDGVQTTGSGRIRSTDSFDPNYVGADANVFTIGENANLVLDGGARIDGSVRATGNITVPGSSIIEGGLIAGGNVDITGGGSRTHGSVQAGGNVRVIGSAQVGIGADGGGIYSGGDVTLSPGKVFGDVFAVGDLFASNTHSEITGSANVNGDVNLFASGGGIVRGGLNYGGNLVGQQNWQNLNSYAMGGANNTNPMVEAPPEQEASNCDPLDSSAIVSGARVQGTDERGAWQPSGYYDPARGQYIINHHTDEIVTDTTAQDQSVQINGPMILTNNQHLMVADVDSFYMRVDGEFRINGGSTMTIPPNTDVTLVTTGDININGAGRIDIGTGSTLTIYTSGRMNIDGGGFIVQDGTPVILDEAGEAKPRVAIFSDYDGPSNASPWDASQSGVRIGGDSTYHAAIYAPKTDVSISGSGELTGSVWGQRVKVTGAARINYDIALRRAFGGIGNPVDEEGAAVDAVVNIRAWQEL